MNFEFSLETQLASAAVFFGLLGILFSLYGMRKQRNLRELADFLGKRIEEQDESIGRQKEFWETNSQRLAEQSRRIAWLESRIRQPKLAGDEILDDIPTAEPPKLNMTERRHRVISLSSRGQNVESIATALGMLTGEVELIVDMNQAAINHKII